MQPSIHLNASTEVKTTDTKFGVVALLDALGARTASLEDSRNYIKSLEAIQRDIEGSSSYLRSDEAADIRIKLSSPTVRLFGDSILVCIELPNEKTESIACGLRHLGYLVAFLVIEGIRQKILFRGAVSVGNFITNQDVILGPAIADVANWYEQLELVGVMATPKATLHIKRSIASAPNNESILYRVKRAWESYKMPTKKGIIDGYLADWATLAYDLSDKKIAERQFYDAFAFFEQPFATELKYRNTEDYVLATISKYGK